MHKIPYNNQSFKLHFQHLLIIRTCSQVCHPRWCQTVQMPPAPSNHVDNVKSYDYDIKTLPDPCSTWCKLSETPRITNKVLVLHLYIVSITFLDTYPSPFLSINLNSFSIGVSSPRNSSTVSRPSKSRSKAAKKWSTLSLILND